MTHSDPLFPVFFCSFLISSESSDEDVPENDQLGWTTRHEGELLHPEHNVQQESCRDRRGTLSVVEMFGDVRRALEGDGRAFGEADMSCQRFYKRPWRSRTRSARDSGHRGAGFITRSLVARTWRAVGVGVDRALWLADQRGGRRLRRRARVVWLAGWLTPYFLATNVL